MGENGLCEIKRIPLEEETQKLVTEDVYTTRVGPQQVSRILAFISKTLPKLEGIEHVKRVKRTTEKEDGGKQSVSLEVIVCQTSRLSRSELDGRLSGTEWQALPIAITPVPVRAPYTKEQFDEWKKVWPVAFRPPLVVRRELTQEDQEYITRWIRRVAESRDRSESEGNRPVAVAIASPKTGCAVAESTDKTHSLGHPLKHAAICCIGQVAELEVERQQLAQQRKDEDIDTADDKEEPSSLVPAKRPHGPENSPAPSLHSEQTTPGGTPKTDGDGFEFETAGYLCEGLDVFASKEPCVMCCMALVHSRIGRLFFLDEAAGGGISFYSMHSRKGLNHHFTAYKCTLPAEAAI
ncbi:hypothetical protein GQ54DRAFT_318181 [Martensiomyces pterosporus]|nr:hypothetical protein GQ54DRAFT_318181 [Martensiomyces pterosporus]